MPTTVKSLEDRLDEFAADVRDQFAELARGQATTQSQLVAVVSDTEELARGQATTQSQLAAVVSEMKELTRGQATTQSQLASVVSEMKELARGQATTQSQLAAVVNALAVQQAQAAASNARLDGVIDDLKLSRARLDATVARLDSPENGLTAIGTKLGAASGELTEVAHTFDAHRVDFASFRSKVETTLGLVKWVGATATVALVTVIIASVSVARSAGNLESTVQQQQKALDEIKRDVSELRAKQK